MAFTKKSVETLIDLVEIKLSCIEIYDNQDKEILGRLEQCRSELYALVGQAPKVDPEALRGTAAA